MSDKRTAEAELQILYAQASQRFAAASDWREYLELADAFRKLDTYKDAPQKYAQCVHAASAPAYREIQASMAEPGEKTAADYREAARILGLIQDYQDARELTRVYTVKAQAETYEEAIALISNSQATCEELGRGVALLKSIRTFRNARELCERYERYYFEKMYAAGLSLMQGGHVWSEFEEAADIFETISAYSDAAELAVACRRKAARMKPKRQAQKASGDGKAKGSATEVGAERATDAGGEKAVKERAGKAEKNAPEWAADAEKGTARRAGTPADETVSAIAEVWHTLDKRRLAICLWWLAVLIACLYGSIRVVRLAEEDEYGWVATHLNALRSGFSLGALVSLVLGVRCFLHMLTARMRRRLADAALSLVRRMTAPLVRAVTKLLNSIGIDLNRRHRLGGRDEKSFVYGDEEKGTKAGRRRLKNELKWAEQPDNAARVRFIFIDYMIRRIRQGYFMRRTMTPEEISQDMALEGDEAELFRVYQVARYAGRGDANQEISDATVGRLRAINQRRTG
jgi:hypothetical protein